MPELPEVETVRRGLDPVLTGARFEAVAVRRPDLRWPFPERMAERLEGAQVTRLGRRSKYILADLSTGETLILHLGMSGRILIHHGGETEVPGVFRHAQAAPEKHDHVVFDLSNGVQIVFNDARRFGAMDLCGTDALEAHWMMRDLGPEPLGNRFDEDYLLAAFRGRNTPVKAALLDQKIVAGLGNIYVCEALHRAGISPKRLAGKVSARRVRALVPVIRETLQEAIGAGGSSLRDYRQTDGDLGYFQHAFRVYGREGAPCPTPGCGGTVGRIVQSGRSTFYCPRCQR